MEKQAYGKKTLILCAVCLSAIAVAAFFSMSAFTRTVFGNTRQWQVSFAVFAACLIVSAAVKKPAVVLAVSAAAAVAMFFYTPFYGALFFPVALQAALWEAARDETKGGTAVFVLALLLVPASIPLRVRLWKYLTYNAQSFFRSEFVGEACVCLAGLVALLALWIWLLVRSLRRAPAAKKTPAKKRGRPVKRTGGNRWPAVYAVCALNAVLSGMSCVQLFTGEYVKMPLFANVLFVCYLLFRQEPTLYGWQQTIMKRVS